MAREHVEAVRFLRAIDQRIAAKTVPATTTHFGQVTTVSPLTIRLDGAQSSAPAMALHSYTPAVNDFVLVHLHRGNLVAVGTYS